MRTVFVVAALIVVVGSPVRAERLRFALPEFTGGFATYNTTVVYTGEPREILSVSVRVVASIEQLGRVFCIHAPGVPEEYWGWFTFGPVLRARVWRNGDDGTDHSLDYRIIEQSGDYNRRLILTPEPGFDVLQDGDLIHVRFDFWAGVPAACLPVYPGFLVETEATLTGVTLLIDVPDSVPVEQSTWGRIKSLYGE
jgi:hypothetical protein